MEEAITCFIKDCRVMNFLRRGSKKSLIKSIHIPSGASTKAEQVNSDDESLNLHQPQENLFNDINALRKYLEKTENDLQWFRINNERLESERRANEDRANYFEKMCNEKEAEILSLATRVEVLTQANNDLESEMHNEGYKIRTQCMKNLEEELERVNSESRKTVRQLRKKIEKLQENHAKSKQDYALKVFALKDEKKKLIEDNVALQDRLQVKMEENANTVDRPSATGQCESSEDPAFTPRNKLVIQLSQQVTTLDVENQELKQELEKTKRLLKKFELKKQACGIRTSIKSQTKHEQWCVSMASLELGGSASNVELQEVK